jgi:hypothetical protein
MFGLGKGGTTSTTKFSILMAIWDGSNSKVGNETKEEIGMDSSKTIPKESYEA